MESVQIYEVADKVMQLITIGKFSGEARNWYHSKLELVTMNWTELKIERRSFYNRSNKVALMKTFESRRWKKGEKFSTYYHDKVTTLGNRVGLKKRSD